MGTKAMGWRGYPAVVEVTGGPAGSSALPGTGDMEWACSVGKCGRRAGGPKEEAGWVTGIVWQGEAAGRVQVGCGQCSA